MHSALSGSVRASALCPTCALCVASAGRAWVIGVMAYVADRREVGVAVPA